MTAKRLFKFCIRIYSFFVDRKEIREWKMKRLEDWE